MAKQPKFRYFTYSDGFDPTVLSIGNLVHDYKHPKDRRPYYQKDPIDLLGSPPWATKDDRTNCVIMHENGHVHGFDIDALSVVTLGLSKGKSTMKLTTAKTGSMIELTEPHEFFEQVILKSENAQKWLQTRLTAASTFSARMKSAVKRTPEIWLCTGVYLMSNTSQRQVTSHSTGYVAGATAPLPDPILAALQMGVGGELSTTTSETLELASNIVQEKVWAAQWQRVKVKVVAKEKVEKLLQNEIRLMETFSLTTVRGEKVEESKDAVQLDLDDKDKDLEDVSETFDEEEWEEFDEEVTELEICLEEEQNDGE